MTRDDQVVPVVPVTRRLCAEPPGRVIRKLASRDSVMRETTFRVLLLMVRR